MSRSVKAVVNLVDFVHQVGNLKLVLTVTDDISKAYRKISVNFINNIYIDNNL